MSVATSHQGKIAIDRCTVQSQIVVAFGSNKPNIWHNSSYASIFYISKLLDQRI